MTPKLEDRLTRLEQTQQAAKVDRFTPEEAAEAARRYEAMLHEDDPSSTEAEAYFATATLHQLASDYDAMLKGAAAPWE
ncbi:hypothetical protein [Methylobacterium sp. J-070]|uniref:hypothetical protein n=1 Tax=Methylobacterium sp. J-070 TaxID=2836650 RepID=UPI001FBB7738|nr:hypothetical protein [Methylobacterium sp. J-070]MCJ2052793.1 hypothetical protein [Methylobacterium sp. J-070]